MMDTVRLTTPGVGAVVRSLVGVLALTALALYAISPTAAMWTAGAGIIAGAIALQDTPGRRLPIVLIASVEVGAAALLGSSSTGHDAVFVVVVACWCFMAGMQWALGANAGFVAAAAAGLLVITPPEAMSLPDVLATVALTLATGLVQALLVWLRPPQRWRAQQHALTRAHRSLAQDARRLASDTGAPLDPAQLTWLREVFTTIPQHQRPKAYQLGYQLPERIAATLVALRRTDADLTELSSAAGEFLDAIAEHGVAAHRGADRALHRVDAAAAAVTGPGAAAAQRFSEQLHEAAVLRFGRLRGSDLRGSLSGSASVLRRHLTSTSPVLRHAIRLAAATAVAVAVARFTDLREPYWMALTVLLILRPETAHTYTRCAGRLAGIAGGILVASAISLLWPPTGIVAAISAAAFVGVAYAVWGFGYIAVSAALAASVVFLLGIVDPVQGTAAVHRLVAVAIGGGLALIAHVSLPDDAMIRLRQRAGELLMTEIDYAAMVVRAFVHELDRPADALAAAWQRAYRARAAFEAASGATRLQDPMQRQWLRSLRTALNAITGACTTMESNLPAQPVALSPEFVAAVDDYVDALRGAPPNPAALWTVDLPELMAADRRVRELADTVAASSGARVLVTELAAITRSLGAITPIPAPTWA
ncbi:fusaric acid resistance protein [Mycobacterium sp. IS-1496]|uniref:FUSC family protein n=1 Tax=Mycobacterium sp. IS-1496 TaxID=1772284 RepID=UPI0007415BE0|nr:FUSC family protein [Mycobacterium sp. IS-1496]KUI37024.1 fusaric acid resistance protein [Mycobacterium sp. IS-1496]